MSFFFRLLALTICALTLASLCPAAAETSLFCDICGKAITGKYMKAGSGEYHQGCFDRAAKCPVCGLPVTGGKKIHPPCESKCLKCGVCSRPITEKYVEFDGAPFHKDCFDRVEKCGYCGGPIKKGQAIRSKGKAYHTACTAKLVRCASCGELISGSFTRLGDDCFHDDCFKELDNCAVCSSPVSPKKSIRRGNEVFHDECLRNSIQCDVCGVYIKGEYIIDAYGRKACSSHETGQGCFACHFPKCAETLDDGRKICGRCLETSVTGEEDLWRIFRKVTSFLKKAYGISVSHDISISMGSVDELREKWNDNWKPGLMGQFSRESEFLEYSDGSKKTVKDDFSITVLSHIPSTLLEGVLAHEFFHAWQAENFHENATLEFKEGTAEAISHQYLLDNGHEAWARGQKANKVDLYRENLLKALDLLAHRPVKDFVLALVGLRTFP